MDEVEGIEDAYARRIEVQQDTITSQKESNIGSSNTSGGPAHLDETTMIDEVRTEVKEIWESQVGSSGERRTH